MNRRVLGAAATLIAATAFIATTPATAAQAGAYGCSGGLVRSWTLNNGLEIPVSRLHLYYDSRTGYNCAVNVWTSTAGDKGRISVSIRSKTDSATKSDSGNYRKYAGPVKTYGKDRCVRVTGYASASNYSPNYDSGWVACR
ncbi:hypothetical protein [Nonomuraea africana]|uniref:Spore-associated protein A n=1 Tax=Nonomuraea africana TaxID=46171 RepID=A0ABR9KDS9_9ACTN|nr:hypothetical protein [Nonomuraea africana]MBE1560150.1 hypothetical protein [Nonomuraea africana]